jgi:hypothetical protein
MTYDKPIRKKIRPWLSKRPRLYSFVKSFYNLYSNLTGPMHVLPDFLIIGAAKSGTSSLYDYLVQHPSIFPCIVKEPNYFARYYDKGTSWYKGCFSTTMLKYNTEKIKKLKFLTGEASTQYYWYPHVPKRVKQLLPNVKLIILLRNPVDRSFSHYQMEVRHGNENLSFEEAIKEEEKRTESEYEKIINDEYYFSSKYTMQAYIAKSIYIESVKRWTNYFPKEQILFVNSADFYKNTPETMNKIFDFLDLPHHSLSNYEVIRKGNYSKIKSSTRQELLEFFKPYNEELYKHIGINFDWNS